MRLGDVLSKQPQHQYVQVDGFLVNKKGYLGQKVNLSAGTVALNYFCANCDDLRTFSAKGSLTCIFVNKQLISIDCVLSCVCGATVQVWFLIECKDDITSTVPEIRILKKTEKLSNTVKTNTNRYGAYTILLDKAEQAYRDDLGAGAIVYLRKVFETVTIQAADAIGIDYPRYDNGNPRNFADLLQRVDGECEIIPKEFSKNGYRLFRELSTVVHGDFDEEQGLMKFEPLHRLVIGILENVRNKAEFKEAMRSLGWSDEGAVAL